MKKLKQFRNQACLICDNITSRDNEPYCTVREQFTEKLPEIKCEADCPQRRVKWIEELPSI